MASESITLRPAHESDVPALVRLLRRSWLVTWAPELPFEAVQAFASFDPARLHAENEWRSFIVAVRDDVLVGMMHVEADQIAGLHVDHAYWNGGVGSKLLNAAERQVAHVHPVVRLEVRGFNTRARAFYARHGWIEVRSYPGMECGSPVENIEMTKRVQV
ncbi:N-acetyltransferase family protein [Methylobacterium sp. A54F]